MEPEKSECAYFEFTALLRTGRSALPNHGWSGELIGAHVAANNDQIADAAERISRGERPDYDHVSAVDDAQLRAYATSVAEPTAD